MNVDGPLALLARAFRHTIVVAAFATLAVLSAQALGCARRASTDSTPVVRLVRDTFVGNISEPLAREYARALPDVHVQLIDAVGSVGTVEAIKRNRADIGFTQADVAYFSHVEETEHRGEALGRLRAIAALQMSPLHLLLRPGLEIRSLADLKGLRVRVGSAQTGQARTADLILGVYGLGPSDLDRVALASNLIGEALAEGSLDAAFAAGYYPAEQVSDAVERGAKLFPISGPVVARLTHDYPFVQMTSIPAGTYPGQHEALRTIGLQRVLVTRLSLDDGLVYALTREFFEALPRLGTAVRQTSFRLMEYERAPATPIPLHPGAAQYYRERALER